MKKYFLLIQFFTVLLLCSCSDKPTNVPFPKEEMEFSQPTPKKLIFTESEKLSWDSTQIENFDNLKSKKFDYNKLKTDSFFIGDFQPFKDEMIEKKLELDALKDSAFKVYPSEEYKLRIKTTLLGEPKRVKAEKPKIIDGSYSGILTFDTDHGMPGNNISCLLQDSKDFIWLGTNNGLCKFDGETFQIYTDKQGLSYNTADNLTENTIGNIFVSHAVDFDIINTEDGIIKNYSIERNILRIKFIDRKGLVWCDGIRDIFIIDIINNTVKKIKKPEESIDASFIEDSDGQIWIGYSANGIDIISLDKNTFKHLETKDGLSSNNIRTLFSDGENNIWAANATGVDIIDKSKNKITILNNTNCFNDIYLGIPVSIVEDDSKVWIAGGEGIDIINLSQKSIRHIGVKDGLSNNMSVSLLKDKSRQMWIGNPFAGANVINLNFGVNVKHPYTKKGLMMALPITEGEQGLIFRSGPYGLQMLNVKNGTRKLLSEKEGFYGSQIDAIIKDKAGNIWSGNDFYKSICVLDLKNDLIKYLTLKSSLGDSKTISNFFEDSKGLIWIVCNFGDIEIYNPKTGVIKHLIKSKKTHSIVGSSFAEDNYGNVWVNSYDGVVCIDREGKTLKYLKNEMKKFTANYLFKDSNGQIWVGTDGGGVDVVDMKNQTLKNFSLNEGLSDMNVYSVIEKNKNIYIGTEKGLTEIITDYNQDKYFYKYRTFKKMQGLSNLNFQRKSFVSKDGHFWWNGTNGVTIFDEPKEDSLIPPTYITGIEIMENRQNFNSNIILEKKVINTDTVWSAKKDTFYLNANLPKDTGYLPKNNIIYDSVIGPYQIPVNLELPFDQNHLTFHFTGTHLDNLDKTRYRYILDGSDKSWSAISDKSFADYRNLTSGKYVFKVSSCGFNEAWSEPVEFSFTITPPWWQTYWAYSGYVILFTGTVFGFNAFRTRQLKERQKELEQIVVDRTAEVVLQKKEIEKQKEFVEEKNIEITDSINYARRIQRSLLPHRSDILKAFPKSFVLFKPKDIVSGDFYWFRPFENTTLKGGIIAAADCTGHGVPGAFMSTIGIEKLHDSAKKTTHPGEMLQHLNRAIKTALRQGEESGDMEKMSRDGMDIALLNLQFQNGGATLKYAAANRPLWVIRSGTELQETKATKTAMGGFTDDNQVFETHEISLNTGDTVYIFTDGFADQFGATGKKLMTKKFKETLVQIQTQTMPEQKEFLDRFIEDWKSGTEQTDDILVIGIRI